VEDVHQRGLAGAVLTEERVDLARPDLEIDVVVGDDARIALRDAAHLERRGFDHRNHDVRGLDRVRLAGHQSVVPQWAGNERADRPEIGRSAQERLGTGYGCDTGSWPHFAGHVGRVPAFMPARASSSLAWVSGPILLVAS